MVCHPDDSSDESVVLDFIQTSTSFGPKATPSRREPIAAWVVADANDSGLSEDNAKQPGRTPNCVSPVVGHIGAARERRERLYRETLHNALCEDMGIGKCPEPTSVRVLRGLGLLRCFLWLHLEAMIRRRAQAYKTKEQKLLVYKIEVGVGILIVLNAVSIGVDASYTSDEARPAILSLIEHAFVALFLIEFFWRFHSLGWVWMLSLMNLFDTFLIVAGVLASWILGPLGVNVKVLRCVAALRILRLARLCKTVRTMPAFRELWMLVTGLQDCLRIVFSGTLLVGTVQYMFAIGTVEMIAKADVFQLCDAGAEELAACTRNSDIQELFGAVPQAMMTLLQMMTFEGWTGIARPIIQEAPELCLLIAFYVGVAGIMLVNLVTAVVIRSTMEKAALDSAGQETARQQDVQARHNRLIRSFRNLDTDGSGEIDKKEFMSAMADRNFARAMTTLDIDAAELPFLFDILDPGSGQVGMQRFCDSLHKLSVPPRYSETAVTCSQARAISGYAGLVEKCVDSGEHGGCSRVARKVAALTTTVLRLQKLTPVILQRLDQTGLRRCVTVSAPFLSQVPQPCINVITPSPSPDQESHAETVTRDKERKSASSPSSTASRVEPLPHSWVKQRQEQARFKKLELYRQRQRLAKSRFGAHQMTSDGIHMTAVAREFQQSWSQLSLCNRTLGCQYERTPDTRLGSKGCDLPRDLACGPGSVGSSPTGRHPGSRPACGAQSSGSSSPSAPPLLEAPVLYASTLPVGSGCGTSVV